MSAAYYNEIESYPAQWLRNLIAAGHIAPGDVDERSIEDVKPDDLKNYTQVHMFAGIAVWSHALRLAGWPDDRRIWTGSCPCQPFSAAGKGNGFADERHLWPAWHWLIEQCRPECIVGEQVASKNAEPWIDLVHADLEALGYAFGCVPFPAAGVGAPHIRDRAYWVAHASDSGRERRRSSETRDGRDSPRLESERLHNAGGMGIPDSIGWIARRSGSEATRYGYSVESAGDTVVLGDASSQGLPLGSQSLDGGRTIRLQGSAFGAAEPVRGFWSGADWIACRDGKWRPVEARIQQMVDGVDLRMGPLCPDIQRKIKEVLNETAFRLQIEAEEILRTLREAIGSEDIFGTRGGVFSIHEAQILLAYLLESAGEERKEPNSSYGASKRDCAKRDVRVLWNGKSIGDSPQARGSFCCTEFIQAAINPNLATAQFLQLHGTVRRDHQAPCVHVLMLDVQGFGDLVSSAEIFHGCACFHGVIRA